MKENKVYVAFGFHVNCYHSYRGDSNDAFGFAQDLRIMRKTIAVLDEANAAGIPAMGTWDFENGYSLEKILPANAPDIIAGVKRRIALAGDEAILMGYNNGAMGAMDEAEFLASVDWARHNRWGSGLQDLFGAYEPIIRPQEMMFSPTQIPTYHKAGIRALCLYYSCCPFDSFRTLIPALDDERAFNPLTFTYEGESLEIIPTYSNSDIIDAGSLGLLVSELHLKQLQGSINHDLFLFINMDADSFLWEEMKVPGLMRKWPNFGGIKGLIGEIKHYPYVVFSTPGKYLKEHPSLGEIHFGEDLADGNFTGYASWAEKPFNRQIWTRLEKARSCARVNGNDPLAPSFEERIRLLSTTHFGLASPVLNLDREKAALSLSQSMLEKEAALLAPSEGEEGSFVIENPCKSALLSFEIAIKAGLIPMGKTMQLAGEGLIHFLALPGASHPDGSLASAFLIAQFNAVEERYHLTVSPRDMPKNAPLHSDFAFGGMELHLGGGAYLGTLSQEGKPRGVLQGFIDYDHTLFPFSKTSAKVVSSTPGSVATRVEGELHLPQEQQPGSFAYTFYQVGWLDGVLVQADLHYPYTPERNKINTQASSLGRFSDARWRQVAPFEITLDFGEYPTLFKRSFEGKESHYSLQDFLTADPRNSTLASFNHQLTGGFLRLEDPTFAFGFYNPRQYLSSMAFSPMRLEGEAGALHVSFNPFGTYYGPQRHYPTRGNSSVAEMYVATMPQAQSLAPSYNGAKESFLLFLSGRQNPDEHASLLSFADGAVLLPGNGINPCFADHAEPHQSVKQKGNEGSLKAVGVNKENGGKGALLKVGLHLLSNLRKGQRKLRKVRREIARLSH